MATSYDELAQIEERLCEDLQLYERKVDLIENGNDEEEGKKVNKIMKNKENKDMNGGKRQKMKDRHEEVE